MRAAGARPQAEKSRKLLLKKRALGVAHLRILPHANRRLRRTLSAHASVAAAAVHKLVARRRGVGPRTNHHHNNNNNSGGGGRGSAGLLVEAAAQLAAAPTPRPRTPAHRQQQQQQQQQQGPTAVQRQAASRRRGSAFAAGPTKHSSETYSTALAPSSPASSALSLSSLDEMSGGRDNPRHYGHGRVGGVPRPSGDSEEEERMMKELRRLRFAEDARAAKMRGKTLVELRQQQQQQQQQQGRSAGGPDSASWRRYVEPPPGLAPPPGLSPPPPGLAHPGPPSFAGGGGGATAAAAAAAAGALQGTGGQTAAGGGGGAVFGLSTQLEKGYLRLTSLPTQDRVRPPDVLRAALEMVLEKWRTGACEYGYACDQLKAIRQDLTVQLVKGPLAVDAYEAHSRIALAAGDLAEFRSCHGMLRELYPLNRSNSSPPSDRGASSSRGGGGGGGGGGASSSSSSSRGSRDNHGGGGRGATRNSSGSGSSRASDGTHHQQQRGRYCESEPEFAALGVLYAMLMSSRGDVLSAELAGLDPGLLPTRRVRYALQVVRAVKGGGPGAFWRLYHESSGSTRSLMDALAAKLRPTFYAMLLRAFLPALPLAACAHMLGFAEADEAAAYIEEKHGGVLDVSKGVWDVKTSRAVQAQS